MPRVDFCHWVMVDIPADVTELATGQCSDGVTPKGKQQPVGPPGSRQGLNDYTGFMAGNPDMAGQYFGYDGPCPPWNDELLHRYVFSVYALDVDQLDLPDEFSGPDALKAMQGHILASASLTGTYTLNPSVKEEHCSHYERTRFCSAQHMCTLAPAAPHRPLKALFSALECFVHCKTSSFHPSTL
jgi:Raf kinase inhibitor-like YbhB/YbcL family protein